MLNSYNRVKVFSATKARDREELGERVTEWMADYDGEVVDTVITQSSDREFHCFTITLFCTEDPNPQPKRKRRRNGG